MMRSLTALLSVMVLALLLLAPARPGLSGGPEPAVDHKAAPAPKVDFCHLKGAVYLESVESFADYRVFVDEDDRFADLLVFRENARSFCTEGGLWYFVDNRAFADFTVAYTKVQGFADFSIHLTQFKSLAGCQK